MEAVGILADGGLGLAALIVSNKVATAALAVVVAVEGADPRRQSQGNGHLQGPDCQITSHPVADGPAKQAP